MVIMSVIVGLILPTYYVITFFSHLLRRCHVCVARLGRGRCGGGGEGEGDEGRRFRGGEVGV